MLGVTPENVQPGHCFVQVYQARLRPNSEPVAVKVQRPGVRAAMALDLYILRQLANFAGSLLKLNTDLPVKSPFLPFRFTTDALCDESSWFGSDIKKLYLSG